MKIQVENGETVAKRAYWLAWQACGGPLGMGILQNQPSAGEEDVWNNVKNDGDYPGCLRSKDNDLYGDYVFGRMMKLSIEYGGDYVTVRDEAPKADYQGWCTVYSSYERLIKSAIKSLEEDEGD